MRAIKGSEIREVGEDIEFYGAAKRMLERFARKSARKGRPVTERQVAEGLMLGIHEGAVVQAHLAQAMEKLRQLLKKRKNEDGRHG